MKEKAVIPINQEEISCYLRDIRKLKVMTPERERELALRMLSKDISKKEKEECLLQPYLILQTLSKLRLDIFYYFY